MIELYGFGKNIGLLDGSPFVMKIHTFLKVAGLDYKSIGNPLNVRKSPKGKLPYIKDDGQTVSDSQFIIEYLSEKYNIDLNSHLSDEQKANAYLLTKSLDENLYWCIVWSRWQHDETWNIVKKDFFKGLPFPLSAIIPNKVRKQTIKALYYQGIGRHSESEIIAIANHSFQALSTMLGDKNFFFGDKLCLFDITAYSMLSSLIHSNIDNELHSKCRSYDNLVSYCNRIRDEYFK